MTPAYQDIIIGRGYGQAVEVLQSTLAVQPDTYHNDLVKVTNLIQRDIDDKKN